MQLALGVMALAAAFFLRQRLLLGLLIGIPGGWLLWVVRPHLLAMAAIGATFAYVVGRVRLRQEDAPGSARARSDLIVIAFIMAFSLGQMMKFLGMKDLSLNSIDQTLNEQQAAHGPGRVELRQRRRLPEPGQPAARVRHGAAAPVPVGGREPLPAPRVRGVGCRRGPGRRAVLVGEGVAPTRARHAVPPLLLGVHVPVRGVVRIVRELRAPRPRTIARAARLLRDPVRSRSDRDDRTDPWTVGSSARGHRSRLPRRSADARDERHMVIDVLGTTVAVHAARPRPRRAPPASLARPAGRSAAERGSSCSSPPATARSACSTTTRSCGRTSQPAVGAATVVWWLNVIATTTAPHVLVHAGCVGERGAVLLPGASGAGKSTLVRGVRRRRPRLPLRRVRRARPGRREPSSPYARPIELDGGLVAASTLGAGIAGPLPPAGIVFPRYDPQASPATTPLEPRVDLPGADRPRGQPRAAGGRGRAVARRARRRRAPRGRSPTATATSTVALVRDLAAPARRPRCRPPARRRSRDRDDDHGRDRRRHRGVRRHHRPDPSAERERQRDLAEPARRRPRPVDASSSSSAPGRPSGSTRRRSRRPWPSSSRAGLLSGSAGVSRLVRCAR